MSLFLTSPLNMKWSLVQMPSRILPFRTYHPLNLISVIFGMHFIYLYLIWLLSCLHFPQDWEATNSKDSILISPIPNKLQVQRLVHNRCSAHVCWIDFFKSSQTTYFHSCFQKQLALCFVFPSRRLTSKELKLRTVTLPNTMAGAEIIVNKLRISSTHLSLISYILERWCY